MNYPSVRHTKTGDQIVYQFQVWDTNLWTQLLKQDATPTQLVSSTWVEYNPVPSPVDDRVAFVSKRSGATEIWISDHGQERQLTHLEGPYVDSPRWSPSGDALVFTAQERGNRDIYLIPGNGGALRRLTNDISEEGRASFSRDGRWVYFRSNRTGKPQIWKMPLDGGPAVQVTKGGGYEAFESPNGTLLYYIRDRAEPGLWMVPTGGGDEVSVLLDVTESRWSIADDGIYYLVKSTVYKYDYQTHERRTAAILQTTKPFHTGFSVSHTGTRAYWTQIDEDSADVMRSRLR